MDTRKRLADVRRRTDAYGLDGSFREYVAFVNGYDMAWNDTQDDHRLLAGFSRWLGEQLGGGGNVVWWNLVLRLALPEMPVDTAHRDLNADQDRAASDTLFTLLDHYLSGE